MSIKERTKEFHALIQRTNRMQDNMPSGHMRRKIWDEILYDLQQQADDLAGLGIDRDYLKELKEMR